MKKNPFNPFTRAPKVSGMDLLRKATSPVRKIRTAYKSSWSAWKGSPTHAKKVAGLKSKGY